MMRTLTISSALAIALLCLSSAEAGSPWSAFERARWPFGDTWPRAACHRYGCCDDYCAKPAPCVRPNCRGCVDDYCDKPLPFAPCYRPGCADDYCSKIAPCPPAPACGPWYQCGPPERPYCQGANIPCCTASSLK